jgi:hypothetical protein
LLLKTYTFYFRRGAPDGGWADAPAPGRDPFEPVLCQNDSEARTRAEAMLSAREECLAVDVCFGHDLLFRVSRDSS